jgi:hypothetical protein
MLFFGGCLFFGWGINRSAVSWLLKQDWIHQGVFDHSGVSKIAVYVMAAAVTLPGSFLWNHNAVFRHMPVAETEPLEQSGTTHFLRSEN